MSAQPDVEEMRRLSAVVANYNGLRGLILVPIAVWMLIAGALHLIEGGGSLLSLPLLVLAFVATGLVARYYRRHYGQVRTREFATHLVVAVVALGVFLATHVATNVVDAVYGPGWWSVMWIPGLQMALLLSCMTWLPTLVVGNRADWKLTRHWQVLCAVVAALSLLPLGLLTGGVHPLDASGVPDPAFVWTLGACFLVGGLLDHRTLRRSLNRVSAQEA